MAERVGDDKAQLAAVCGTYCGACPAYLAKHGGYDTIREPRQDSLSSGSMNRSKTIPDPSWMDGLLCDGCLSGGEIPTHCRECSIKACAAGKPDVTRCSECEELPCTRITEMIDTGLLHRGEYMTNLGKIREMGVGDWLKSEEERWLCPRCALPTRWYDEKCARCGEARSERLFPLA